MKWCGRNSGRGQPLEGAAVRFEVLSGNMLLSEEVEGLTPVLRTEKGAGHEADLESWNTRHGVPSPAPPNVVVGSPDSGLGGALLQGAPDWTVSCLALH